MKITYDQCNEIMAKDKKNWDHFCENEHGTCFWNQNTGQIIWTGDECNISDPEIYKASKKKK